MKMKMCAPYGEYLLMAHNIFVTIQLATGGGGGDIGKKINNGGGDGGDDGGDDDDYFDDFEDGDEGDEGGIFRRRIVLQEVGAYC